MKKNKNKIAEVAIVGAGPIGIELAVALKRAGIDMLHFDAKQIGHTLTWWPRQTYFFSTTERIALAGTPIPTTDQDRVTGEEYLAYLRGIVEQMDLDIRTFEPVTEIQPVESGFELITQPQQGEQHYRARRVVLAIGDMHAPNLLNIPGEDLPHVSHYFERPHTYFRKRLLIVGGRNSAVEAALRCWRAGADVTLSYRRADFDPACVKQYLLPDIHNQIEADTIGFYPQTVPVEITPEHVVLERTDGSIVDHAADFVLLLTGFVGDMSLFERAGVELIPPERAPRHDAKTMETNVAGLYVAGTAAGGERKRSYSYFIENCHVHVGRIVKHITGEWPQKLGTIPARHYELMLEDFQSN